jgi:hypothetical protein
MVGAVFASLFSIAWWPYAFWAFAVGLCLLAILAMLVIPKPATHASKLEDESFWVKIRHADILGGTVGVAALVLINIAWVY